MLNRSSISSIQINGVRKAMTTHAVKIAASLFLEQIIDTEILIFPLPRSRSERKIGTFYFNINEEIRYFDGGKDLKCQHICSIRHCEICNPSGHIAHKNLREMRAVLDKMNSLSKKNTPESRKKLLELSSESIPYLGITNKKLKEFLEFHFFEGMSFDDRKAWHIDHIWPTSKFDLTREEDRIRAFHYTNLLPEWGPDNIAKGNRMKEDEKKRVWTGNGWVDRYGCPPKVPWL
jgi:hypothetical protein